MSDVCSGMTKEGSKLLICDRPRGHYPESDHHDQTKDAMWREERWGSSADRVIRT